MKLEAVRQFVNRQDEVAFVMQRLNDVRNGVAVKECLINVYGVPGIGKTALLAALAARAADEHSLVCLRIDLARHNLADPTWARQRFLHALVEAASPVLGAQSTRLRVFADDDSTAVEHKAAALAAALAALNWPLLLLVDAWDQAADSLLAWVERMLLLPLVQTERLLCVLSSRMPLRWRQFQVRRRATAQPLLPFGLADTQSQLGVDAELARSVIELTFGLPLANEIVRQQLSEHADDSRWIDQHGAELSVLIVSRLRNSLLGALSPELRRALEVLVLFREFDVNTLRVVLPQFFAEYRHRSQAALLLTLKQLVEMRVVSWNTTSRSYQIDPTIRCLLARAELHSNPQQYVAVQQVAIRYYERLLQDVPGSRHVYLLEYLYHRLQARETPLLSSDAVQALFGRLLQSYVSPDGSFVDTDALDELVAQLQADHELARLLEQYQISPDLLTMMLLDLKASVVSQPSEPL